MDNFDELKYIVQRLIQLQDDPNDNDARAELFDYILRLRYEIGSEETELDEITERLRKMVDHG